MSYHEEFHQFFLRYSTSIKLGCSNSCSLFLFAKFICRARARRLLDNYSELYFEILKCSTLAVQSHVPKLCPIQTLDICMYMYSCYIVYLAPSSEHLVRSLNRIDRTVTVKASFFNMCNMLFENYH